MNEHIPNTHNFKPDDEDGDVKFRAFNELARVNDTLAGIQEAIGDLNRRRNSGELTQEEFTALYDPLTENNLPYYEARKVTLEQIIDPPEATRLRKLARGALNIFRRG